LLDQPAQTPGCLPGQPAKRIAVEIDQLRLVGDEAAAKVRQWVAAIQLEGIVQVGEAGVAVQLGPP
jgi:hypothetical protein